MAFMAKFKVGDKVRIKSDCSGCLRDDICALRDGNYKGDQKGVLFAISKNKHLMETGKGCLCQENWELVTAKKEKEINPPFYVDCPTSEIWDRVEQKMFDMGYRWNGGQPLGLDQWDFYKENTFIGVYEEETMTYSPKTYYESESKFKHIPYQEFLGEVQVNEYSGTTGKKLGSHFEKVEVPKTAIEDTVKYEAGANWYFGNSRELYTSKIWERFYGCDWGSEDLGKPIKSFTQRIMATLRSIPDRLKRALNANLRAFYKLGWIDGDLDVTERGESELKDFLFDKFEKELGAIALKRVKDASKKKKNEDEEESEDEE